MKTLAMIAAAGLLAFAPVVVTAPAWADHHETGAAMQYTLEDGTQVTVEDGHVFVWGADGTKTPAPDGNHVTSDGSTLHVKDGMIVPEDMSDDGTMDDGAMDE